MCLVSIACIFQALYDTCQERKDRSRKKQIMEWKRTEFFVRRLQKSDFPIPILISCLQSVIAPKRIDRFWCAWCQSLAFFKLYKNFGSSNFDHRSPGGAVPLYLRARRSSDTPDRRPNPKVTSGRSLLQRAHFGFLKPHLKLPKPLLILHYYASSATTLILGDFSLKF